MNYELAKKLKDAGFPQRKEKSGDVQNQIRLVQSEIESCYNNWPLDVYIPTLSELIEACERTGKIDKWQLFWEHGVYSTFVVTDIPISTDGQTPEEAVAKLWLALNK